MASFPTMTVTNAGQEVLAKGNSGQTLLFPKIVLGDGELNGQSISALTALISQKAYCDVTRKTVTGGAYQVGGLLLPENITSGFYWREIGLIVTDPDTDAEVLYAYANAGTATDYIDPNTTDSRFEKNIYVNTKISSTSSVTISIPSSDTYAMALHASQHAAGGNDPLTPGDIGAAVAAEVDAALAGKADAEAALKSTGDNPTNFKLNQVARIINEDARFPVNYGTYVCARSRKDNTGGCYALHLYYGGDYLWFQQTNELNEITLAGWHKLTTTTPPTVDDLTLADGVTANGACKYAKTQDGIVIIYGSVAASISAGVGKTIAFLPEEYRPSDAIQVPISSNTSAGSMTIYTNGQIDISTVNASMYTFICALFIAGN